LGADTVFLLATEENIIDPLLLVSDGVLAASSRGVGNRFEEFVTDISDAGVRGAKAIPTNWVVQQLVLPSRP